MLCRRFPPIPSPTCTIILFIIFTASFSLVACNSEVPELRKEAPFQHETSNDTTQEQTSQSHETTEQPPDHNEEGGTPKAPVTHQNSGTFCLYGYQAPHGTGRIASDEITEASGLAASTNHPDVLWTHNDSGDTARVFAVRSTGELLSTLTLDGITAIDFEDMDEGPCLPLTKEMSTDAQRCLWIADTGDNKHQRESVQLYRVVEPTQLSAELTVPPMTYHLRYPEGESLDSEGFLISKDGTTIYLFEKTKNDHARIFKATLPIRPLDAPDDDTTTIDLSLVTTFESPGISIKHGRKVTGADLHPDGNRLVVRTYTGSFEYALPDSEEVAENEDLVGLMLQKPPLIVTYGPLNEKQGEAISYAADGLGLWTVSEGDNEEIHFYECQSKDEEDE